jgi:hypothetical protein
MRAFSSSITIAAPATRIWKILTSTSDWPRWNTTVDRVEGNVTLGSVVKIYAKSNPARPFEVEIVEVEAGERLVWRSGTALGLFRGTRTFKLTPQYGRIRFDMSEEFTGLLAPLLTRSLPNLQPAFDEFARCLQAAAETD